MTRYKNNIDNDIFTRENQELLLTKNIGVIGCGGQGRYVLEYLARLGVKSISFWDGDHYEESNLNRQIGCLTSTIGKNKAEALAERIKDINPDIKLICHNWFFGDKKTDKQELMKVDFIFNAADCNYNISILRNILKEIILFGIPVIECPVNSLGGYIHIETNKDLGHFDFITNALIEQYQRSQFFEDMVSQPAWKCALIAAEAVNQMTQYSSNIRYVSIDTTLHIDTYHHRYFQEDRFGKF